MVLTVHHLDNSRSQRILWLLEELRVPYGVKSYKRDAESCAPKELMDARFVGMPPALTGGGFALAESGAIVGVPQRWNFIDISGQKHEQLSEAARVDILYLIQYAEGSLMPILMFKLIFDTIPENAPVLLRSFLKGIFNALNRRFTLPRLRVHADFIETHLNKPKSPWFAGGNEPTGADSMTSFLLELWYQDNPSLLGSKTQEFVKTLQER